jgi:transcriptional regulator with XRE-family HTH domain
MAVRRAMRDVGESLRTWRKLRGLTAEQVADRADITRFTLRKIETGEGTASFENVMRVVRVLGVLDELTLSLDPTTTDLGRLRASENLPDRVRPTPGPER